MRKFKTWRDPYDIGFSTCRPKEIEIQEGLTVLVGCNGAGKSTLLRNIRSELSKNKVPLKLFDNLKDGGNNSLGSALFEGDFGFISSLASSSEGEALRLNIGYMSQYIHHFLQTGVYKTDSRCERITDAFNSFIRTNTDAKSTQVSNERWLLLDAADSGYSIDNVLELKDLFDIILEDGKQLGVTVYIVISANEYELANGEQCFDVNAGRYVTFSNYDDYKKFIIKSRAKKEKRMKSAEEKAERKAQRKSSTIKQPKEWRPHP